MNTLRSYHTPPHPLTDSLPTRHARSHVVALPPRIGKAPEGIGMADKFLSRAEAAELLSIQPSTLRSWSYQYDPPPAVKVGRFVKYPEQKLLAWVEKRARQADAAARRVIGGGE